MDVLILSELNVGRNNYSKQNKKKTLKNMPTIGSRFQVF